MIVKNIRTFIQSNDKKLAEQDPEDMRIKIPRITQDDKSYSSMYQSLDLCHIPRKKQKNKVSENSITGNKVIQDTDDTNKEAKVGGRIEVTTQTSVCVTPHPSGLTPPPYKKIKITKVVQMIRHMIPIHMKVVFLEAMMLI